MRKLGQAQQQRREEYRPAWHTPQIREVENRSRFLAGGYLIEINDAHGSAAASGGRSRAPLIYAFLTAQCFFMASKSATFFSFSSATQASIAP
jgi:hypothetical protein